MGYYTYYKLTVYPESRAAEIEERLKELNEFWTDEDSIKWYDHEEDCLKLSKLFPDVLISVQGEGEENGDIWRNDFVAGELVDSWRLDATIPPPNPELVQKFIEKDQV